MEVRQALEYPLPSISVGVTELTIETTNGREKALVGEAAFLVRNSGGGMLECRIVSSVDCLTFMPNKWENNRQEVVCKFSPDTSESWKPGEVRTFSAMIHSNGGEAILPVIVKIAKMAILTSEGVTISNLYDFYAYTMNYPEESKELFLSEEFNKLLNAISFPYIDAYTMLTKEPNISRALDNFLILAELKKATSLSVVQDEIEHRTLNNTIIHGSFEILKSDEGYVETNITTAYGASWLTLSDLDHGGKLGYSIDPILIKGRYARERIIIKAESVSTSEVYVDIIFKRPDPLAAWLSRETYRYQDEGTITLENRAGNPLQIEISCGESFVRFFQQRYEVDDEIEIPFIIKLSALQSAQMLFRKIPSLQAKIDIKSTFKGTQITKSLTLQAGEW